MIIPLFNVPSQLSWEGTVVACCPFLMFAPLMSLVARSFSIGLTKPKPAATLPPMFHLDPILKAAQLTSTHSRPAPRLLRSITGFRHQGLTKIWRSKMAPITNCLQLFLNRPLTQKRRSGEVAAQTVRCQGSIGAGLIRWSILPMPMTSFRRS